MKIELNERKARDIRGKMTSDRIQREERIRCCRQMFRPRDVAIVKRIYSPQVNIVNIF